MKPLDDMLPKPAIIMEFQDDYGVEIVKDVELSYDGKNIYNEIHQWKMLFETGEQIVAQIVDITRDYVKVIILESEKLGPNQSWLGITEFVPRTILKPVKVPPLEDL